MWSLPEHFRVRLGGNTYIDVNTLVEAHGEPLFTLGRQSDNGHLGIDFDIRDQSGKKIAAVKRNQIYPVGTAATFYSVRVTTDRIIFTDWTGAPVCDIRKRDAAEGFDLDVSVRLFTSQGVLFEATPDATNLMINSIVDGVIEDCRVGIRF